MDFSIANRYLQSILMLRVGAVETLEMRKRVGWLVKLAKIAQTHRNQIE